MRKYDVLIPGYSKVTVDANTYIGALGAARKKHNLQNTYRVIDLQPIATVRVHERKQSKFDLFWKKL